MIFKKDRSRGVTYTKIEWLKVPDSQFCGIICEPKLLPILSKRLYQDLYSNAPKWDVLELYPCVEPASYSALPQAYSAKANSVHYFLELNGTWEEYYATKSRRLKKSNNHLANRLKSQGELHVEHVTQLDNYSLDEIMAIITYISSRSWKTQTKTTLDNKGPGNFLRALTQTAASTGHLSIWILKLNQEVIAYEYQLVDKHQIYALRSDFDEKFRDFSPGSYLNWKILETCFAHNTKTYYMGPGVNAYKTRWKNNEMPLFTIKAYAKTLKGRLLYCINETIIPRVKPQVRMNKVENSK